MTDEERAVQFLTWLLCQVGRKDPVGWDARGVLARLPQLGFVDLAWESFDWLARAHDEPYLGRVWEQIWDEYNEYLAQLTYHEAPFPSDVYGGGHGDCAGNGQAGGEV